MDKRILKLREQAKLNGEPILRDASFEYLIKLVKEKKPKKVLEIGTNVGISSLAMMSEVNCFVTGIEIDEDKAKIALENYKEFGYQNNAKIFIGDAIEIIPILTGEYDLIFLDGPKGHYHEFLPNLLGVLSVGGILFADNVLFRGYVEGKIKTPHRFMTTKNSMNKFLDDITTNVNLKTKIIKIEDGISITEKLR